MKKEYFVVTLRRASVDSDGTIDAARKGIDILLSTNSAGNLFFPSDVFKEAVVVLDTKE
jgi:hypothetical protein